MDIEIVHYTKIKTINKKELSYINKDNIEIFLNFKECYKHFNIKYNFKLNFIEKIFGAKLRYVAVKNGFSNPPYVEFYNSTSIIKFIFPYDIPKEKWRKSNNDYFKFIKTIRKFNWIDFDMN